jgi:hypothetical protein
MDKLSKEANDLQRKIFHLRKAGGGNKAVSEQEAIRDIRSERSKLVNELVEFERRVFIPQNLTEIEKNAIKMALIFLEIEIESLKTMVPYYAIGSSAELLWLLLLFKQSCTSSKYLNNVDSINDRKLGAINSLMANSRLTPFHDKSAFNAAYSTTHHTIDTVIIQLKTRADLIAEIDKHRKTDSDVRYDRRESEITKLKADVASLNETIVGLTNAKRHKTGLVNDYP